MAAAERDSARAPHPRAAAAHLRRVDPALRPWIERHGAPPFRRTRNVFRSLATTILHQQLAGAAAAAIVRRFRALYSGPGFPTAEAVAATPAARLRGAGLSRQKALAVLDLAAHCADGRISARRIRRLPDEGIADLLLAVRGIGPWSVDMFLIFALNRPDVLPLGDLGIRKGMQRHFALDELPDADRMTELADRWRPFRSTACWYLWRIAEAPAARPGTA